MDSIDLNSDLGESYGPWRMGDDAAMLALVTSANVACGGHASDPETMFETLTAARAQGVVVGAHPGYPDREGFGRRQLPYSAAECERFVAAQIGALCGVAALALTRVAYVKAHGALANLACDDLEIATAIARASAAVDRTMPILAISGTVLEDVARSMGLEVYSEIFADRGYQANGRLVPRNQPGALLHDESMVTNRMIAFLQSGLMPTSGGSPIRLQAHSICVHGDNPTAVALARSLRDGLTNEGITIQPFLRQS
ncbi:LamB/YcsF family protein [Microvirga massiliensis]|uniref:LamB/YcsF family protein n=1 Tax=Microvirga massiliensis TaxID=1033741 RepID=UPI0011C9F94E|nr:5-oxoprolinase subunit PxpA [Microvirga massiliensis]